ncbi:MAG: sialate O-acetylesterase [Akkermansiaceae bacterium]|nr:sialate O-acetylesterase [Akkermansiaceae bacterium]NNM29387.1 sialate O-acetylesterase [Akkermansiaceae bacterium]
MKGPLLSILLVLAAIPGAPGAPPEGPVKVFILAGQSNMEGAGKVEGDPKRAGGKGSLSYLAANEDKYKHLKDQDGKWVERDDVWIWYLGRKGKLAPGFGARSGSIGPELGFGHVMGNAIDEPVLLIKTAWGGKSLQKDFRPPSSGGEAGPFYKEMLAHVKGVLGDIGREFPELRGRDHEVAGFGWHQGWNDGCGMPATLEYEENLANFIRDVRKDLGVEGLPFVIADSGFGGAKQSVDRRLMIRKAQAAPETYPEFKGNVDCVQTAGFFRPAEESPSGQGYHWNGNAETYYLIGEAMAAAMVELSGE